jgi:periplasmic protein TonB
MKKLHSLDSTDNTTRLKAIVATVIFFALLLMLFFLLAFRTALPLPDEEGIDVILGYEESGKDNNVEQFSSFEKPQITETPTSEPQTETSESQEYITEDIEESPVLPVQKEQEKEVEKEEPIKPERKSNPLYEFSDSDNKKPGQGEDDTEGKKGSTEGKPDATQYGEGEGNGFSFNLKGRGLVRAPRIQDDSQVEAVIVLEIVVNRQGAVIAADVTRGSSMMTGSLVEKAKEAALATKFTPNVDSPEQQYGTLTFHFKLK